MSYCNRKNIFSLMPMTDLFQNPAADLNRDVVVVGRRRHLIP